jgi:hypothetical protein
LGALVDLNPGTRSETGGLFNVEYRFEHAVAPRIVSTLRSTVDVDGLNGVGESEQDW